MSSTSKKDKKLTKKNCDACGEKLKHGGIRIKVGDSRKILLCPDDWGTFVQGLDINYVVQLMEKQWVKI